MGTCKWFLAGRGSTYRIGSVEGFKGSVMKPQLTIRAAHVADATCVAKLIQSVAYYFLSDPSGADAERFISSISEAAIADYIKSPELNYIVGEFGYQLAGAAAIKNIVHVHHLFVLPTLHRQGVAKS